MSLAVELRRRLDECPAGLAGWKLFEDACIDTLRYLLVPPLTEPRIQARSYSGIDRRDAVFPNRNMGYDNHWGRLYQELRARLILFEFKNYDKEEIGKDDVNQACGYITPAMGKLGVICCNQRPNHSAHIKRNSVYSKDGKVLLFITVDDLKEMLLIKARGDDPADLIMDMVESFYLQHE